MYARLVRFILKKEISQQVEKTLSDLVKAIKRQKGCKGATFFSDDADGASGLFVLWDTQANADAAAEVISPQLTRCLAGNTQGTVERRLFPVLQS